MTALPEWMIGGLTAAGYDALPEDTCRQIEVFDGAVVVGPSPRRAHQRVVRKLANVLETACSPHLAVDIDVDLAAYTEMFTVRCGYEGGPMVYGLLEVEGGDLAAGVMPAV